MDRRQDNCSTGVPLPCGLFREPQGIAVFHPSGQAVPAQFRVLERWRAVRSFDAASNRSEISNMAETEVQ